MSIVCVYTCVLLVCVFLNLKQIKNLILKLKYFLILKKGKTNYINIHKNTYTHKIGLFGVSPCNLWL